MEVKTENNINESECLVYDRKSGRFLRTTRETLDIAQEELTKIAEQDGYVTYKDVLDIISRDWPKEMRDRLLGRAIEPVGWVKANEEQNVDLKLTKTTSTADDGKIMIRFDLN